MRNYWFSRIAIFAAIVPISACAEQTTTRLKVVDEMGDPIQGATAGVVYYSQTPSSVAGDNDEGLTSEDGLFVFSGKAYWLGQIGAKKDGFYGSSRELEVTEPDNYGQARVKNDIDATLTLREIRNPVPMAAGRTQMDFPRAKGSYKFDLIERDWLPPHGVGEKADILVHVDFVFNEWLDHNMQITWEFVGEPNGIQPFEPIEESTFISPYLAPINGYEKEVSWRNRRFERDQWSTSMDRYSVENANDLSASGDGRGQGRFFYLFRIRSEVDENGEIVGGHYGKIYGFGAMLRPDQDFSGGHHTGVIYLNPQEGDRNLEMDLEENLLTGLPRLWGPRRP